nr:MAG: hypothetical protein KatS3mg041_1146 [Bacteroidota bacterium]
MRSALVVALTCWFVACAGNLDTAQERFTRQAWEEARGFTRTDASGRVLEEDPEDWRTAPIVAGLLLFHPPYPNPTRGEDLFLPVEVLAFERFPTSIEGWARDLEGRPVRLFRRELEGPGVYTVRFSLALLSPNRNWNSLRGLHRIRVLDLQGQVLTYGDVKAE